MALAYSTETTLSLSEAYDRLISFMTGHGWTIFDNIPINGSRDKVLFSPGVNNKLNMYYRISSNVVGGPYKDVGDSHNAFPYIYFRGYHNWSTTTHSGSGEFGDMGPIMWFGETYSNTGVHLLYPFEKNDGTLAVPLNSTVYQYKISMPLDGKANMFDGRRKIYEASQSGLRSVDMTTGDNLHYVPVSFSEPYDNGVALIKDAMTDREYAYIISANSSVFVRIDIDGGGTIQSLPFPPWGNTSMNGGNMVWDGADFIYMSRGVSTTSWARYSISTNAWTTLAVTPVPVSSHTASLMMQRFVYIPATVTGFGEDVIYGLLQDGVNTIIYRYDVTSNIWRITTGTGALSNPDGVIVISSQHFLMWDRRRYLYVGRHSTSAQIWRSDLQVSPNSFSNLGVLDTTTRTFESGWLFYQMVTKTRISNVIPGKCFFHGDADGVRMVYRIGTNPGVGRYYWSYMGKYDTAYRSETMGLTSAIPAGVRVVANVDSIAGYAEGQDIIFANWSGSHFEKTSIYQFSGSSAFYCNLTSSFPSGSKLGVDPAQHLLTGDSGLAVAPISFFGYRKDLEPDWYIVKPDLSAAAMDRHSPSTRGIYMPTKLIVFNLQNSANQKYELLGALRNVFSLPKKVYPAPQNEDILIFGGERYIYFNPQESILYNTENRGIVIGPI